MERSNNLFRLCRHGLKSEHYRHVRGKTFAEWRKVTVRSPAGIEPAPERSKKTTWKEFLEAHWDVLAATNFFTVEVWPVPAGSGCSAVRDRAVDAPSRDCGNLHATRRGLDDTAGPQLD